ncbi:hypothetical protein CNR22_17860 [Sphingobacteriaceae bacterium]|nr:hypothetical protein CNR22_17860 [Sphingobacteriaceae bacterium]
MILVDAKAVAHSSLLKKTSFFILVILFLFPAHVIAQRKFIHFYRDTVIACGEYSVTTTTTYLRSGLFLKSTISIYNPTDHYLVLDYRSAYAMGDNGIPVKFSNNEDPTFLPHGSYRQRLKFKPMPNTKFVTFHFPKVYVTSNTGKGYEPIDLLKKIEAIEKVGNISIQVLKMTYFDEQVHIRVRIRYEGDKFLAIKFDNICIEGDKSGKIFNKTRANHRMHHRKSEYLEMATLKFPIKPGEKLGKTIHFQNVFMEYTLREQEGFYLRYTLQCEESVDAPLKEELKKEESTEEKE